MLDQQYSQSLQWVDDPSLRCAISAFTSIEQVLVWAKTFNPNLMELEVTQQDEFTFDLTLPYKDQWLVFGTS